VSRSAPRGWIRMELEEDGEKGPNRFKQTKGSLIKQIQALHKAKSFRINK